MITIIIPTLNEALYIKDCLTCVSNFDIPLNQTIEIFVIDGGSQDNTIEIVHKFIEQESRVVLFDNPMKIQAVALNIGIKNSNGDWILRLDAHAKYPKDYLLNCFNTALKTKAENVGGLFITQPGGDGYQAKLVQALTTHIFGVGNAGFRIGMSEGEADTVPYGFYKTEIFKKLGYLDERLVRAQDYEFNSRLIKSGGKIWRNPNIQIEYYNQSTLYKFLRKQIFLEAPYNVYMWYLAPYSFAYRHAITGIFTFCLSAGFFLSISLPLVKIVLSSVIILYFCLSVLSAIQQAKRYSNLLHVFTLPISFFLYHYIHGLGIIVGFVRLLTGTSPVQ
ncbi:glycosyltransferase family 2 protein, partial [bacterium]|nr:glycosyltransferase family 2 protein [bacterium]